MRVLKSDASPNMGLAHSSEGTWKPNQTNDKQQLLSLVSTGVPLETGRCASIEDRCASSKYRCAFSEDRCASSNGQVCL